MEELEDKKNLGQTKKVKGFDTWNSRMKFKFQFCLQHFNLSDKKYKIAIYKTEMRPYG
jgi:hypothetical protein